MKYTYSDWVSDHLKTSGKIEIMAMEQSSFIEGKSVEPEEVITVAAYTEEATEKTGEITDKTTEATNTEEDNIKDNLGEKKATTYKYHSGYHSKKN